MSPASTGLELRPARDSAMAEIARIYGHHHVTTGLGSFEEVAPSVEELARRRAEITARGLPYLVAGVPGDTLGHTPGRVLGYAYAGPFRPRSAYRFSLEDSVYVAPEAARRGIGRALLGELIARSTGLGYRQMVAVIGDSANAASIGLHHELGFRRVGTLLGIGFKQGRWVDSVLMQRSLGPGSDEPPGAAAPETPTAG